MLSQADVLKILEHRDRIGLGVVYGGWVDYPEWNKTACFSADSGDKETDKLCSVVCH